MGDDTSRHFWLLVAAVAGAITSLYQQAWQRMSPAEIGLSLFAGVSFSLFVIPLVVEHYLKVPVTSDLRLVCGFTYLGALVAHVAIPILLGKFKRRFTSDEEPKP